MLRRVDHVRTDTSEERIASIIMVTRIDDLGTTLAITISRSTLLSVVPTSPILVTLMMEALRFSETSQILHSINRMDSVAET
jgi:hypothetical protein